jgi:Zn-dependent peptidase ImmA (M78 family)
MKFTEKGVPILRDNEIEETAYRLLRKVEPDCVENPATVPIPSIIKYLQDNHGLVFSISDDLGTINGRKIRGKTILNQGIIILDSSIVTNDESLYFMTAAHEIGHWTFHRSRKILREDDEVIESFEDEEYSFYDRDEMISVKRKKVLRTSLDFLEHHAKVFAANLLMPRQAFIKAVQSIQIHLGIPRNLGQVYLYDDPRQNEDYRRAVTLLHELYKVPKQAINIRFKELGLFNDLRGTQKKQNKEAIREESLRRAREELYSTRPLRQSSSKPTNTRLSCPATST